MRQCLYGSTQMDHSIFRPTVISMKMVRVPWVAVKRCMLLLLALETGLSAHTGKERGVMQPYGSPVMVQTQAAGFWIRVGAYIIDAIVTAVIAGIISAIIHPNTAASSGVSTLIGLVYFLGFWTSSGRTLGYRVTGLQLVKADGGPITIGTAVIRYVGLIVSFMVIFLGVLWVIWDPQKQGWHDKMAGTLVIRA